LPLAPRTGPSCHARQTTPGRVAKLDAATVGIPDEIHALDAFADGASLHRPAPARTGRTEPSTWRRPPRIDRRPGWRLPRNKTTSAAEIDSGTSPRTRRSTGEPRQPHRPPVLVSSSNSK
jgi:hypothetical protein